MRKEAIITTLAAVLIALFAMTPLVYKLHKSIPAPLAIVDLQKLMVEQQDLVFKPIGGGAGLTDAQRTALEQSTVEYAKKLSVAVDQLAKECHCILLNKAALLSDATDIYDYTDEIREALKK